MPGKHIRGLFHFWESELTFGNLKWAHFGADLWGLTFWGSTLLINLFKGELTFQKLAPQWIYNEKGLAMLVKHI